MSKRTNIFLLVLFIAALIPIKLMKYNVIPTPKLPNWFWILFTFLISSGLLIWGISGVKNYKMRRPKKHKTNKTKFFSTDFTPPEVTISYGQIIGGIMGLIAVLYMILE
jgi:hypothetical protein